MFDNDVINDITEDLPELYFILYADDISLIQVKKSQTTIRSKLRHSLFNLYQSDPLWGNEVRTSQLSLTSGSGNMWRSKQMVVTSPGEEDSPVGVSDGHIWRRMQKEDIIKGVIFFLTTAIGLCSNVLIVLLLSAIAFQEKKMMPVEIILCLLATSNLMFLLTLGLPHSLFAFGVKYFYNDLGCKFNELLMRSSRVMVMSQTCLLSCFQGVALASINPMWAGLKSKMEKHIIIIIMFLWSLSTGSSITTALYSIVNNNRTELQYTFNLGYCLTVYPNKYLFELIGFISSVRDATFVVLMAMASIYILLVLLRHRKQMKGKRSSDHNQDNTVELQAAKMVVTFVTVYVLLFGIDSTIYFYQILLTKQTNTDLTDTRYYLSFYFSTVFPFILIAFNQKVKHKIQHA
ncbi:olfactory receptor class A-like protein 1 [Protopterus annectens]|uniref:olfactory receptor class A-like protein 1 n=1 Tax=Protopterus annectens TaxID=7888 RepID=UPI001CFAC13C|nr:olfactory receptor class A-like protein 1 [Protopterus annectens]